MIRTKSELSFIWCDLDFEGEILMNIFYLYSLRQVHVSNTCLGEHIVLCIVVDEFDCCVDIGRCLVSKFALTHDNEYPKSTLFFSFVVLFFRCTVRTAVPHFVER